MLQYHTVQVFCCALCFGNQYTLISESKFVPSLKEHPTTEKHAGKFNLDSRTVVVMLP